MTVRGSEAQPGPVVALAGLLKALEAWSSQAPAAWGALFVGALISFVCAYATIHFFLKLVFASPCI